MSWVYLYFAETKDEGESQTHDKLYQTLSDILLTTIQKVR